MLLLLLLVVTVAVMMPFSTTFRLRVTTQAKLCTRVKATRAKADSIRSDPIDPIPDRSDTSHQNSSEADLVPIGTILLTKTNRTDFLAPVSYTHLTLPTKA